jgi:phosphoribosyl 1,2-cyclic phosphate phosphodiesterase
MNVRILGSGTSTGVPVIGCDCEVCSSTEQGNKRTRASILVEGPGGNILIDTSPDLRAQALANSVRRIDAVLYTHLHADHLHGIDDLRSFNRFKDGPIPCYGSKESVDGIERNFGYIFGRGGSGDSGGWKPNLTLNVIETATSICGLDVMPVEVSHGTSTVLGYRMDNFAYLTDCNAIPEASMKLLKGVDTLVIGALRPRPHPSHFSIDEAIDASKAVGAKRTILTHMGHSVDYLKQKELLPAGVELAFDGMVVEINP